MNYFKTAMLLAGLTALFMGVGYLIGGSSGAILALIVAAGMNLFTYLIPISLAAVTLTLFVGLFALFRGGDFGRSYSNKLMRLRVLLQAVAILVLVGAVWWRHNAGG